MRHIARAVFLAVALAAMGLPARAQTLGTIAGAVKDASGAVLPGVTVEAASPALIEKSRTTSDGCHTATGALRQDLFDCELGDEDKPFQVGGGETAKLVGGVVRERLGYEDARIVDDVVDRAELSDRGLCDLLSRRCLTNVSVDECEIR